METADISSSTISSIIVFLYFFPLVTITCIQIVIGATYEFNLYENEEVLVCYLFRLIIPVKCQPGTRAGAGRTGTQTKPTPDTSKYKYYKQSQACQHVQL